MDIQRVEGKKTQVYERIERAREGEDTSFSVQILLEPENAQTAEDMATSAKVIGRMREKKEGCEFVLSVIVREKDHRVMAFGAINPAVLALVLASGLPDSMYSFLTQAMGPAKFIVRLHQAMGKEQDLGGMYEELSELLTTEGITFDAGQS